MDEILFKQLEAVIDQRTTPICLHAAGQIRPLSQPYTTLAGEFDEPPFHRACRSITVPFVKGMVSNQRKLANAEVKKRPPEQRDPRKFVNTIPPPTYKGVPLTSFPASATPRSVQVADDLLAQAQQHQPRITATVNEILTRHGGNAAGLGFRLKGRGSLAGKIAREARAAHKRMSKVAEEISDAVRYTGMFSEAQYARGAQAVIDAMRAEGYTMRVKNYWTKADNPYQGINVAVTSPDGVKFELQFHTRKSLAVKEGDLHKLYDQLKEATTKRERDRLNRAMKKLSKQIPVPDGVANVR